MSQRGHELLDGCTHIDAGFRLRETDEYIVEVHLMLFNWRLVVMLPGQEQFIEHGYCYFGTGAETLALAVAAAKAWEDPLHTDPVGFNKKAF